MSNGSARYDSLNTVSTSGERAGARGFWRGDLFSAYYPYFYFTVGAKHHAQSRQAA